MSSKRPGSTGGVRTSATEVSGGIGGGSAQRVKKSKVNRFAYQYFLSTIRQKKLLSEIVQKLSPN